MAIVIFFVRLISVTEEEIPFTRRPSSFDGAATESVHSWIPSNTYQEKIAGKVYGCGALLPNGWRWTPERAVRVPLTALCSLAIHFSVIYLSV